jgi:hypothetical protein
MFAKARELRAAGEDLDEMPTTLELLREALRLGLFPPED